MPTRRAQLGAMPAQAPVITTGAIRCTYPVLISDKQELMLANPGQQADQVRAKQCHACEGARTHNGRHPVHSIKCRPVFKPEPGTAFTLLNRC